MSSTSSTHGVDTKQALETGAVLGLWLIGNITIMNMTKWVYEYGTICTGGQGGQVAHCKTYQFPLAITTLHMVFCWAFSYVYIFGVRREPPKTQIFGWQRLAKVGPLAACFAASVAMGNLSLEYIYPSFNQMVSSASPLITFSMAVAFTGAAHNRHIWASMVLICGGMIVCAENEAYFSIIGTLLVVGSTVLRSAKSIIQGELLSSVEDKLDSVTLLYYMSPYAAGMLLVSSLAMEGSEPIVLLMQGCGIPVNGLPAGTGAPKVMTLVALSGVNAFVLNISTFLVTAYTNATMLQVLGNVKGCVGIIISVMLFGNPVSQVQGAGVAVCLVGVYMYQRESAKLKVPTKLSSKERTPSIDSSLPMSGDSKTSDRPEVYGSCA